MANWRVGGAGTNGAGVEAEGPGGSGREGEEGGVAGGGSIDGAVWPGDVGGRPAEEGCRT